MACRFGSSWFCNQLSLADELVNQIKSATMRPSDYPGKCPRHAEARQMEKLDSGAIGLGSFRVVRPMKNGLMAEQVVIQVREMIRQGSLKPGDRLPPERELAKRLGISRASLRHGLRALTAIG